MVHLWGLHPLQGTAERVDAGNITYLRGVLFCFFLQLPWSNKWLPPTVPNSLCRSLNLNHTLSSLRDYSGWLYGWSCFLVLASILYLLVIKRLYLPSCGLWGVLQYCQTWQKKGAIRQSSVCSMEENWTQFSRVETTSRPMKVTQWSQTRHTMWDYPFFGP